MRLRRAPRGTKPARATRLTVDLGAYPDLVVIYLGMRVNRPRGLVRQLGFGPKIQRAWKEEPDGLLLHEDIVWSLLPPHIGMRQYWRDFDSLERWTRSQPHRDWWRQFLADTGGTGFWHEAYFIAGGAEAIYDDLPSPIGFARFAPTRPARGAMFSSRRRAGRPEPAAASAVVSESEYYGGAAPTARDERGEVAPS